MHSNLLSLAPRLARVLALATLVVSLGGCAAQRQFDVTGVVKYNGTPLAKPNGQIVFVGPNGAQVAAPIGQDGTYKAVKVTAGLNKVAVYYPNPAFTKPARPKGAPTPGERPPVAPLYLTPEGYSSTDTSNLSVQVDKGTTFNVDMTGPPIP
jgi:hypothetical protein